MEEHPGYVARLSDENPPISRIVELLKDHESVVFSWSIDKVVSSVVLLTPFF